MRHLLRQVFFFAVKEGEMLILSIIGFLLIREALNGMEEWR